MFGFLQGGSCALDQARQRELMAHVCGLCLTIGRDQGQLARLATTYDAALLSVLHDAQLDAPAPRTRHRCPLRPGVVGDVVARSPATRHAASVNGLMAAARIADHVTDQETMARLVPRLATRVAERLAGRARDAAAATGFPADSIERQVRRQAAVERQPAATFLALSRPTELAAAAAFGHTAVLAGRPGNVAPLEAVGALYGRITYLLDAVRDYAADQAAGRFNALARCVPEPAFPTEAARLFHDAHAGLVAALDRVALPRPALTRALLVDGLGLIGTRTLAGTAGQWPSKEPAPGEVPTMPEAPTLPAPPEPPQAPELPDAFGQPDILAEGPRRRHRPRHRRRRLRRCRSACRDCCDRCDCCDCCCECCDCG